MKYADGIYTDISIEDYHKCEGYSATQIKYARQSLWHFYQYITGKLPRPQGSHFSFGNAFELALMSPDEYLKRVAVFPDGDLVNEALTANPKLKVPRNSTVYSEGKERFFKESQGKYVINDIGPESFETIEEMLSSCYQDKVIQGLIKNTEYQLSLFWTDEETGLQLKTRPDFLKRKKNVIVNVKTIVDGSPSGFVREMTKYDYPLQATIEIAGCLNTGVMDSVDNYFWLVVEKVPPYNATIYEFTEDDQRTVRETLAYTLSKIKRATDENHWPGYTQEASNEYGILEANLPPWYKI